MTDTKRLRNLIKSKGLKYQYIAEKLGLSSYALQQKIDNKTDFKSIEIQKMCEILGIKENLELKEEIFFANAVDL